MSTPQPPTPDEVYLLASAKLARSDGRQKPSRRHHMLYAAEHAAKVLEDTADALEHAVEHDVDPAELRLTAEGLRYAALRLGSSKPPRQPRLPQPGYATRLVRSHTAPELDEAAVRIVNDAAIRLRKRTE